MTIKNMRTPAWVRVMGELWTLESGHQKEGGVGVYNPTILAKKAEVSYQQVSTLIQVFYKAGWIKKARPRTNREVGYALRPKGRKVGQVCQEMKEVLGDVY